MTLRHVLACLLIVLSTQPAWAIRRCDLESAREILQERLLRAGGTPTVAVGQNVPRARQLQSEFGMGTGPVGLDEAYVLAAVEGDARYTPLTRRRPDSGRHIVGEEEIYTELRTGFNSARNDMAIDPAFRSNRNGVPIDRPNAPEFLLERRPVSGSTRTTFEAVEVKNMVDPDVEHAIRKFNWTAEMSARTPAMRGRVQAYTVVIPQGTIAAGRLPYPYVVRNGRLYINVTRNGRSVVEPVRVRGLPRGERPDTMLAPEWMQQAPSRTDVPDVPVMVREMDLQAQPPGGTTP